MSKLDPHLEKALRDMLASTQHEQKGKELGLTADPVQAGEWMLKRMAACIPLFELFAYATRRNPTVMADLAMGMLLDEFKKLVIEEQFASQKQTSDALAAALKKASDK